MYIRYQELSRELVAEKRRVVHTTRKLEQCSNTCAELRESLTLAQDTVSTCCTMPFSLVSRAVVTA